MITPINHNVYKQYAERVINQTKKEKVVNTSLRITKTREITNKDHEFPNSFLDNGKGKYIDQRI
jgi:hypothetical protein